jgi:hypothetical protein
MWGGSLVPEAKAAALASCGAMWDEARSSKLQGHEQLVLCRHKLYNSI